MKQLVILSDRYGTGKTMVAAALAHMASQELSIVTVDASVDGSGLELVLSPTRLEEHDLVGPKTAYIDTQACSVCGTCLQACRFGAILPADSHYSVDGSVCQGCHSCFYQCPVHAIQMHEQWVGQWFRSATPFGPLFHARLVAGQENRGKLVTLVRQQARLAATNSRASLVMVVGPPVSGDAVTAASAGSDAALLLAEPTVGGAQELERMLSTTKQLTLRVLVLLDKHDGDTGKTQEMEDWCAARGAEVVAHVPFDMLVAEAVASPELRLVWQRIKCCLGLTV